MGSVDAELVSGWAGVNSFHLWGRVAGVVEA